MKKCFVLMLTLIAGIIFSFQAARAQFPKIKTPKLGQPQSTQTDSGQPASSSNTQPAQPQPDNRNTRSTATEAAINKPSIQINLRTHRQYYRNGQRDEDTWSWSPRIAFRVNGPIPPGSQLSVEFMTPSGKSWIKFDCNTNETKEGSWWHTECGMNSDDVKDEQTSIETGMTGFKINLKNELEGANKNLFTGKFKVEKFVVNPSGNPKFKNNFSYYVNYDWALPIAYVYSYDGLDIRTGNRPSQTEARLSFATWFKSDPRNIDYGKYAAYLYYKGQLVADSAGGGSKYGDTACLLTNAAYEESSNTYCLRKFVVNAMVWDKQAEFHPMDFKMYENPGEYEIKILENGKLARTAKFTMGPNGQLVDSGVGKQNNLGTGRIVLPVQITGDQDGTWERNAYKMDAFFGSPLTGFVVP